MRDPASGPPPGSGKGLIPLTLPRQGPKAASDVMQIASLRSADLVSRKKSLALSFYDPIISDDNGLLFSLPKQAPKWWSTQLFSGHSISFPFPSTIARNIFFPTLIQIHIHNQIIIFSSPHQERRMRTINGKFIHILLKTYKRRRPNHSIISIKFDSLFATNTILLNTLYIIKEINQPRQPPSE